MTRLFEIIMNNKFYYTSGATPEKAAEKVRKAFGCGVFSHAYPTGDVKFRGVDDCKAMKKKVRAVR
jgi:hypothetical protein